MSLTTATTTETTTEASAATTTTTAITANKSTCYLNENQNCDDEDLDEINLKPHLSFHLLLHTLFSAINQCK